MTGKPGRIVSPSSLEASSPNPASLRTSTRASNAASSFDTASRTSANICVMAASSSPPSKAAVFCREDISFFSTKRAANSRIRGLVSLSSLGYRVAFERQRTCVRAALLNHPTPGLFLLTRTRSWRAFPFASTLYTVYVHKRYQ